MKDLAIDIETRSSVDLAEAGVYRYAESEDFSVLLFACSVDGGAVQQFDLAHGEALPEEIFSALTDPQVTKWAFNSAFERICLSRMLGMSTGSYIAPEQFRCSMTWAGTLGYPMTLKGAAQSLGLTEQKMDAGKRLIRKFCSADSLIPFENDADWQLFKEYSRQDVVVEQEIRKALSAHPVPQAVWEDFWVSERVNDRGVAVNMPLVEKAISFAEAAKREQALQMALLTGLDNPNSVAQLKAWLAEKGLRVESLGKKQVKQLLPHCPDGETERALELRLSLGRSSVKKYAAMRNAVNEDDRLRGMFRFYGAQRTGRFASKIVQLQNLPKNSMPDLHSAQQLLLSGDYDRFAATYGDVADVLSQLIRTAFEGPFFVADESSIEARVLAWLAGERWRMEAFAAGKDIYCESASQMFHVPVEKNGRNAELRPKGKVAELALGYGGGTGALIAMGALDMGLEEAELPGIVSRWRAASPSVVALWHDVEEAAMNAVIYRGRTKTHGLIFEYDRGYLFITLPSGRRLAYPQVRTGLNRFGGDCLTYMGVDAQKQWSRLETYGAKLVENIVQGIARDVLCGALAELERRGRCAVMHIHDEIVMEADDPDGLAELQAVMGRSPEWAPGLLLRADGDAYDYYRKD